MGMNPRQKFDSTLTMRPLDVRLRQDIRRSLLDAIAAGAVFPCRATPLDIFRSAVSGALGLHSDRLAKLVEDCGDIASEQIGAARPEEYYWAVRFAVSRAVSAIQGSLAEMLALGPVAQIVAELKTARKIPKRTRIWVGDAVVAPSHNGRTVASAADVHLLLTGARRKRVILVGVAEVKSYRCSQIKATAQIDRHLARARLGLVTRPPGLRNVYYGVQPVVTPLKIFALPARWRLSRHFKFESRGERRFLVVQPPKPTAAVLAVADRPGEWKIALRWSNEALAAAAYEIVLWCLGRLGERVYGRRSSPWPEMSAAEAGQNAATMALYYAIRYIDEPETLAQAIKLYNILGFGFALGSSFRGRDGQPAMLWAEDLDEILRDGITREGGYLEGMAPKNRLQRTRRCATCR